MNAVGHNMLQNYLLRSIVITNKESIVDNIILYYNQTWVSLHISNIIEVIFH